MSRVQHAVPAAWDHAEGQDYHDQTNQEVQALLPVGCQVREEADLRDQQVLPDDPPHHDHARDHGRDRADANALDRCDHRNKRATSDDEAQDQARNGVISERRALQPAHGEPITPAED